MNNLNFKMSDVEADEVISNMLKNISEILLVKAKEYVRNGDRMHNFNRASLESGKTREECLDGFRLKHIVSSKDIINDINQGKELPSIPLIKEKYTDIINYYILEYMSVINKVNKIKTINNEQKNSSSKEKEIREHIG